MEKTREVRGIPVPVKKFGTTETHRFCDLLSSHAMRRTAITNMLMLGMDETLVRKISGHSAGSKDFFRYVEYAQTFMDNQTDDYFERLSNRRRTRSRKRLPA